jgi:hypothetical protein
MMATNAKCIRVTLIALVFTVAAVSQTAIFEGTVKGLDGAPVKGAVIRIERTDMPGRWLTKTSIKGQFIYSGMPIGVFNVTCSVDGNDVGSVNSIRMQPNARTPVNFDLRELAKKGETAKESLTALGSVYVNSQNNADRLQLKPDRSFSLQEGGQPFSGTYSMSESTLKLHIEQLQKDVDIAIQGNRLIVNGDEVWIQPNQ